ncbi:MAG: hypothetical protein IJT08_01835 [Alphaproteobacteria bacterium]|nr:hypothetical protein [Alphaproteobacteria bacterium]
MKPVFSNGIGVARSANNAGITTEIQLDFVLNYTEASTQMTQKGPVAASIRKTEPVASVLLTRDGVVALIGSLRKTMGDEFADIMEFLEARDEME